MRKIRNNDRTYGVLLVGDIILGFVLAYMYDMDIFQLRNLTLIIMYTLYMYMLCTLYNIHVYTGSVRSDYTES